MANGIQDDNEVLYDHEREQKLLKRRVDLSFLKDFTYYDLINLSKAIQFYLTKVTEDVKIDFARKNINGSCLIGLENSILLFSDADGSSFIVPGVNYFEDEKCDTYEEAKRILRCNKAMEN